MTRLPPARQEIAGFAYRDDEPRDPGYDLERTRHRVARWRDARE
jgi:hypothetical protein